MHLKLLLFLILMAIFWTLIESRIFSIDPIIRTLEPYSGMSPEHFFEFQSELRKFRFELYKRPEIAKRHLNQALDSARDMALNTRTADSSVQNELNEHIDDIRADLLKRIKT
jgi:hypothetical protein